MQKARKHEKHCDKLGGSWKRSGMILRQMEGEEEERHDSKANGRRGRGASLVFTLLSWAEMLSKQKPKFKKVLLLLLLLLLSAHERFSTLHTLTTLAEESPHSKRVCLCVWFPRGPPQERVAEGRCGEEEEESLQRWSSKPWQRERERERERENWAQSNKIRQNFTKVCVCKFFNSRKEK